MPESAVVELTDSDTPPTSQNRLRATGKLPAVADVASGLSTVDERDVSSVVTPSMPVGVSQKTGVVTAATGHGPSVLPMVNPEVGQAVYTVGAQPVGPPVSSRPVSDPMSHLTVGLTTHPAYAHQCLAPPVPAQHFVPCSVTMAPAARPLCAGVYRAVD